MPWLDRTARASFRGFEFLTDSHDSKGGRRLAIHEFPGADQPEVEDLGAKAAEWHLNAYFIGADYDLSRNYFLSLLNQSSAEWLTHPWLGKLWVRPHSWSVHESTDKGGFCTVSVDFVPGGGATALPSVDRVDTCFAAIGTAKTAISNDFILQPIAQNDFATMVARVSGQLDAVNKLIARTTLPLTMLSQVRTLVDGMKGNLSVLLGVPSQYATAMLGLADLLGSAPSVVADAALPQIVANLARAAVLPVSAPAAGVAPPYLLFNLQAESDLRGRMLLLAATQAALADYQSANDRDAALSSVIGTIDALLPSMSDAVFQAALDMRATLIDALMAQQLAPAVVKDIVHPLPAVVLAHRLGVSDAVFAARNAVRHPLFVQGRVYG